MAIFIRKNYTKQEVFVFKANLIHDPTSQSIMGIDRNPRYRIEPTILEKFFLWTADPASIDEGYILDKHSDLYVKNSEDNEREINVRFGILMLTPPFGFASVIGYAAWANWVFQPGYQSRVRAIYESKVYHNNVKPTINHLGENIIEIMDHYMGRRVESKFENLDDQHTRGAEFKPL